jgi:hypothetical protein
MSTLKALIVVSSALLAALALGWLAYHYVVVTEQFFRLVMV